MQLLVVCYLDHFPRICSEVNSTSSFVGASSP
jgi:hypothetical protein